MGGGRGEEGYKSSGNQRVASKRTFQRFWDDTVTGSSPRASLHRVVSISEWADQKEERHMRTNERTSGRNGAREEQRVGKEDRQSIASTNGRPHRGQSFISRVR